MKHFIYKIILINATPSMVWKHLTSPDLMQEWMGDPEMKIEILSEWKPGAPITIKGFHHVQFENKGTILQFEPERVFQYEYLSSMSNLEDLAENYTTITFYLSSKGGQTELRIEAENFPTIEIYKHLEFYWNGTVTLLRNLIEKNN